MRPVGVYVTVIGAGFRGSWRGLGAGFIVDVSVFLLIVRAMAALCSLPTREVLRSRTKSDAEGGSGRAYGLARGRSV